MEGGDGVLGGVKWLINSGTIVFCNAKRQSITGLGL